LLACKGEDAKDGETTTVYIDSTTDTESKDYILLSSLAEKGPCDKGASVLAFPLYGDFIQTGDHFLGETKNDLGFWEVPANIPVEFILTEAKLEGPCYSELDGSTGDQKLGSIFFTASTDRNINSLTTIAVDVIRWVYNNQTVKDESQAIIDAELLVSNVFGFGAMAPFASISLNDSDLDAAKLAVASAAILKARSNQTDFMVEIAQAIKSENTTAIEAELSATINSLQILDISNNLKTKYESLNQSWVYPPMHIAAGYPDYYEDLLTRTPVVTGTFNLDDNTTCSFDQSTYNLFAIPHVFDSTNDIESSKYIATNLDKDLSIWSKGTHVNGHLAPETKLLDITQLREIILDNPKKMKYNGLLGDNHGLTNGTDYYIVTRSDTDFTLSTGCEGGLLPFGRKLASQDEGLNWIGHDNNTPWFRKSGLVIVTTD
jgi:hypothetical protein